MHEIRRYGTQALLATPVGTSPLALAAAARSAGRSDVAEVVPAAATVLVIGAPGADLDAIAGWLARVDVPELATSETPTVDIEVVYDGEDLADVAAQTGMSVDEVIARHSGATYRCEFCG